MISRMGCLNNASEQGGFSEHDRIYEHDGISEHDGMNEYDRINEHEKLVDTKNTEHDNENGEQISN